MPDPLALGGGYTVSKVIFESLPGFFVTGNLYKPMKIEGKVPGVLFSHGHHKDARLAIFPSRPCGGRSPRARSGLSAAV